MLVQNRVRFIQDKRGKDFNKLTPEEDALASKALYTGHAVFWQDVISLVNANYPNLNMIPGNQLESGNIIQPVD